MRIHKYFKIIIFINLLFLSFKSRAQEIVKLGVEDNYILRVDTFENLKCVPCKCLAPKNRKCYLLKIHISQIIQLGDSSIYSKEDDLKNVHFILVTKKLLKSIPKLGGAQIVATNSDSESILKLVNIFKQNKFTKNMIYKYPEGHFTGLIFCHTSR